MDTMSQLADPVTARGASRPARLERVALVGILVAAVALRLYAIASESIWSDEAFSLMLARMDLPTLVEWTSLDIHPPLYYVLLHYWTALGETETAIRALSALAGVLTVLILYKLGRVLFNGLVGLYAALLLAANPYHIWYSQEARMYAWVTLFVSLSVLLALKVWRRPCLATWAGYVLSTTAALYTHYYAVFGILIENLFFVYLLARGRLGAPILWRWIGSQALVFILFLPWFPTFLLPATVGGGGWIALGAGKPGVEALAHTAILYLVGTGRALYPVVARRVGYALFVAAFVLGVWPRFAARKSAPMDETLDPPTYTQSEAAGFCLAYLALPPGIAWAASQVFKPMYSVRYMLPFLMPFTILVARGTRRVPNSLLRAVALLALLTMLGMGVYIQANTLDKPDWRGLATSLTARSLEGDLVMFMPGWHARAFDYYARGALPLHDELPVPANEYGDLAVTMTEKAIAGHPRIWYVWETDHYSDPQGMVYEYLQGRCRQVSDTQMPRFGRIVLFENPASGDGS